MSVLLLLIACDAGDSAEESPREERGKVDRSQVVLGPNEADNLWVFPESADSLGSGFEFHIYLDAETHPDARGSFAKFGLSVGGALPAHRHDKTEEISYFLAGEGVVQVFENGEIREVPVRAGHVWYVPPGAWHGLRNTGEEPLKLVFATIPNEEEGLLSLFRRIGVTPGAEPAPLPPDEFAKVAAEHDLILRPESEEN